MKNGFKSRIKSRHHNKYRYIGNKLAFKFSVIYQKTLHLKNGICTGNIRLVYYDNDYDYDYY
jgi:hypothetical protein